MIEKASIKLVTVMYWIAGIAIILMMVITCGDVTLRYFRRPIPGTFELVCFLGAVAASFAMAYTSVKKGHVSVSLLVRLFPPRTQAVIGVITELFSLILFSMLSWQSILYGNDLRAAKEVSMTIELPFYPFVYGMSFAAAAVCLVLLVSLSHHIKKVFEK